MTVFHKEEHFSFNIPLNIIEKSEDGDWRIGGIASTENKDFQGEVVKIEGLDISTLSKNGFFNQDHKKGFENILGKVDFAEKREDPEVGKHLYVEGKLFKTQPASQAAWNIMQELEKGDASKRMQMSVEGKILKREGKDKKVIAKAKVENVALTLNPINEHTFASFVKSFEGCQIDDEVIEKGGPGSGPRPGHSKKTSLVDHVYSSLDVLPQKRTPEQHHDMMLDLSGKIAKKIKGKEQDSDHVWTSIHDTVQGHTSENQEKHMDMVHKIHSTLMNKLKKSEDEVVVTLSKATCDKLLEYADSKKDLKQYIYDLCKGMSVEERNKVFKTLIKAKETLKKDLTATHSYATQLPSERTGGDVMTQESIDGVGKKKKKKKIEKSEKEAIKSIVMKAKEKYPNASLKDLVRITSEKVKERSVPKTSGEDVKG